MNANELLVLKACADNALDAAGGDFGFSDEVAGYLPDMSQQQVAGYLSDLQNKGAISLDEFSTDEREGKQITLSKAGLGSLFWARVVDEEYVNQFEAWHHE